MPTEPMRFPVMLTFDLDADCPPLPAGPDGSPSPAAAAQRRYGATTGLRRLLGVLSDAAVPATFFVPGWVADHHPEALAAIVRAGHEVGHHGYTHVPPFAQSAQEEQDALVRGIESLRRASGRAPVGYRSPAWDFSPRTLDLLAAHGFAYSSNLMDDDRPYRHHNGVVELPVQWILDDYPHFAFRSGSSRPMSAPSAVWDAWTAEFDGLYAEAGARGTCFVLTMHPHVMGRPGRAALLRRFVEWARRPGVVFARCAEVADRVERAGADGHRPPGA